MSLYLRRIRLNWILLAVELFLVVALAVVLADVALTLRAINEVAGRQQERALLAAGTNGREARSAQNAHRLQIPAIGVDSLVYEGWDDETLRQGVGLRPGSPAPGEAGNLLLSAHNDIHGAIFRHLHNLEPGDAVYIATENVVYTYVVRAVRVVSPDSIWVTLPTAQATATLISCYPYLLDTQRIVVFADFAG